MKRKKVALFQFYLIMLINLLAYMPCLFAAESDKIKITFKFNPKDGTPFIQKSTKTTIKKMESVDVQTDQTTSIVRVNISRTAEGWDVRAKPVAAKMTRNGQKIEHPIFDLLSQITITYKLDAYGTLQDIAGFDALPDIIRSNFPPQVATQLAQHLNEEFLKHKEATEWNGRIGDYLNRSVNIGDI